VALVLGALAVMVASGLVSRAGQGGPAIERSVAAAAPSQPPDVGGQLLDPPPSPDAPPGSPVSLRLPRTGADPLTGSTVAVEGALRVRAASVEIVLEGRGKQALASRVVDTTDPNGGIRPVQAPVIDVELPIPTPRPVGRLWVVITAYDRFGTRIGTMYRVVQVGEISPIGRPPSDPAAPAGPAAAGPASRPAPTRSS
jgi:hypothetical protein